MYIFIFTQIYGYVCFYNPAYAFLKNHCNTQNYAIKTTGENWGGVRNTTLKTSSGDPLKRDRNLIKMTAQIIHVKWLRNIYICIDININMPFYLFKSLKFAYT